MPIRILLVDDHPLVRVGLTDLIGGEPDFELCGAASGVAEARQIGETRGAQFQGRQSKKICRQLALRGRQSRNCTNEQSQRKNAKHLHSFLSPQRFLWAGAQETGCNRYLPCRKKTAHPGGYRDTVTSRISIVKQLATSMCNFRFGERQNLSSTLPGGDFKALGIRKP